MTHQVRPGHTRSAAVCPSCSRYIGPAGRCPYCHADTPQPLTLRILRAGSVLLAVAGLVLLYLVVTHRELPVQKIGEITPLMNHAYVRLVGEVSRNCYVGHEGGVVDYVLFSVKDDTGSVRVTAHGRVARELSMQGLLPEQGARVDVAGSLYVVPGKAPELRVRAPRQLKVGGLQE